MVSQHFQRIPGSTLNIAGTKSTYITLALAIRWVPGDGAYIKRPGEKSTLQQRAPRSSVC